ncbi:hypothetical protein C8F04DRAFT_1387934 [Mycena alexandri]|uniref:DUF6535 domain-containing protein n=1 Tax=Mycena alexandri TaxID=1745969 RepID=A0AAD6XBL8_9AGAR|nr:hypothetical protein C8F04DRAFT_1387934 [Mycena alexandri]
MSPVTPVYAFLLLLATLPGTSLPYCHRAPSRPHAPPTSMSMSISLSTAPAIPRTKVWPVYVSEAEKYDTSPVESWKLKLESDMEGMLTGINSLGVSLACALVATLLEQWARDFYTIRARVFSFLYYSPVVDAIPLLLHTSLLFFFAGLVAFLLPINPVITYIAVGLLVVVLAAYSLLTVLRVWYLDCPYRTPLSAAFWRISQFSLKEEVAYVAYCAKEDCG